MTRRRRRNAIVYALYANAAVLCAFLVVFRMKEHTPIALGQAQPAIAGGGGVFVMPAQLGKDASGKDVFGCYLMDIDAQTLAVYRFDALEKQLRLMAARSFMYDR